MKTMVADSRGVVGRVQIVGSKVLVDRWTKVEPLPGLSGLAGVVREYVAVDCRRTEAKREKNVTAQISAIVARIFGDAAKLAEVKAGYWNIAA